jgi:hypothetical protein
MRGIRTVFMVIPTLPYRRAPMVEENKVVTVLECPATYVLRELDGQETARGDCKARLDVENLSILPKMGETLYFPFRDTQQITGADYKIEAAFTSREKLTISNLGYKYEDFLCTYTRLYNEVVIKDLLMNETQAKAGVAADYIYLDENKVQKKQGQCELRLYETALVIISRDGDFVRLPYSDLINLSEENYRLQVDTEYGDSFAFSRMGREFDSFNRTLSERVNTLTLKSQSALKEMLPKFDPAIIRRAARFMKEGRAARRMDLEGISTDLWKELENEIETMGIKPEYDYLKSLGQASKICIGIKRGLMGELTGDYIWFLVPVFSLNPAEPGNAIAMEATSTEGSGRATYLFKIVSRQGYANLKNIEDLQKETDRGIRRLNRCMSIINFRREPIYLPDDQLTLPENIKYRYAVTKIPALQELRGLFIGRVAHYSLKQWQLDICDLLKFNVQNPDEKIWQKSES